MHSFIIQTVQNISYHSLSIWSQALWPTFSGHAQNGITLFWCDIFKLFSDTYNCVFEPDQHLTLFGSSPSSLEHNVSVQNTIMYWMEVRHCATVWDLIKLTGILHMEIARYGIIYGSHFALLNMILILTSNKIHSVPSSSLLFSTWH